MHHKKREWRELFEVCRTKGWAHIQGISEGNVGCVPHTELATYAHIWSSTCTWCRWLAIAQTISTRHVQIYLPQASGNPGHMVSLWVTYSLIFPILKFNLRRKEKEDVAKKTYQIHANIKHVANGWITIT